MQSDPIGLDAWVNTFSYVDSDSLSYFDLEGFIKNSKGSGKNKLNCGKTVVKTPRGKGSVIPSKRDKKRLYTPKDKEEGFDLQGGLCLKCGKATPLKNMHAHHLKRHADGGKSNLPNLAMVCEPCHKWAHKK